MSVIYKYQIPLFDYLEIPRGAKLLKIMMQDGKPTAWFEVPNGQPLVAREIRWVMTGEEPPTDGKYIDTLCTDGYHIIHFYDMGEK